MTERMRAVMRRSTAAELSAIKRLPALTSLMSVFKALASLDNEMQIQMVAILLVVAQRPGVYQSEMAALVGVSQSSVSRNVQSLSRYRRDGLPGFELVEQRPDMRDARNMRLFLTVAGVAFVTRLLGQSAAVPPISRPPAPIKDAFAEVHWEVWVD